MKFIEDLAGKIDLNVLKEIESYRLEFLEKKPFKFVVIDNFLENSLVERMIEEFPIPDPSAMRSEHGSVSRKHSVSDV